jgi:hypothetical protein
LSSNRIGTPTGTPERASHHSNYGTPPRKETSTPNKEKDRSPEKGKKGYAPKKMNRRIIEHSSSESDEEISF